MRLSAPDVAKLIAEVYRTPDGGAGCCLHVVTDDGNVGDSSVVFILGYAKDAGHPLCIRAAEALLEQRVTGRRRAIAIAHEMRGNGAAP